MPIYEFCCRDCGEKFEALVPIGKEKRVCCPHCGKSKVKKLISSFGIGGESNRVSSSSSACPTCSTRTCTTCK